MTTHQQGSNSIMQGAKNELLVIESLPGNSYPLAAKVGLSTTTVYKILTDLMDAGVVTRNERKTWELAKL